jgi:hypothetical protein
MRKRARKRRGFGLTDEQLANLKETLAEPVPTPWCKTRRSSRKARKLMAWFAFSEIL